MGKKVWTFLFEEGMDASLRAQMGKLMGYETPDGERFLGIMIAVRPRPLRDDEIQAYEARGDSAPSRILEVKVEELAGKQGRGRRG